MSLPRTPRKPRLKYALQLIAAVALLVGVGLATGVVKVKVEPDTPTVHRVSQ